MHGEEGKSCIWFAVLTENLNPKMLMMELAPDRNRHDIADGLPASKKKYSNTRAPFEAAI